MMAAMIDPMNEKPAEFKGLAPAALRAAFRAGGYRGPTTGLAPGYLQCNLVILPAAAAGYFTDYCAANPRPCPLLFAGDPGDPTLHAMGAGIDVRTDLPAYDLHRAGRPSETVPDIADYWRDDSVALLLGCSLTFEEALVAAGVRLRHLERGGDIAAFRTDRTTTPAGPFAGDLVVSMRAIAEADVPRTHSITAAFPYAHGAPLHVGDPAVLGIVDVERPDWGEAPGLQPGETAAFWACGVTSHLALVNAGLPLAITHSPGAMLIADLPANEAPPTWQPS